MKSKLTLFSDVAEKTIAYVFDFSDERDDERHDEDETEDEDTEDVDVEARSRLLVLLKLRQLHAKQVNVDSAWTLVYATKIERYFRLITH